MKATTRKMNWKSLSLPPHIVVKLPLIRTSPFLEDLVEALLILPPPFYQKSRMRQVLWLTLVLVAFPAVPKISLALHHRCPFFLVDFFWKDSSVLKDIPVLSLPLSSVLSIFFQGAGRCLKLYHNIINLVCITVSRDQWWMDGGSKEIHEMLEFSRMCWSHGWQTHTNSLSF